MRASRPSWLRSCDHCGARDVDEIAGALESLLSDGKLRQELGEKGKRRAAGFTWERAADQTLAVLRRIGTAADRPRKVA